MTRSAVAMMVLQSAASVYAETKLTAERLKKNDLEDFAASGEAIAEAEKALATCAIAYAHAVEKDEAFEDARAGKEPPKVKRGRKPKSEQIDLVAQETAETLPAESTNGAAEGDVSDYDRAVGGRILGTP